MEERIVRQTCADFVPDKFVEAGCGVCGQRTLLTDLQTIASLGEINMNVLHAEGVTRAERFHVDDPVVNLPDPVLDDSCDSVCKDCVKFLASDKMPQKCLANRLWIGKIPWQRKDLSFAERMLIARVRHNRCVVRVNSGRGKLSANAIVFSKPTVQVYNILPPSCEEMSEVLASVFLGPTKPTDEQFVRTPMLVRRQRVQAALEWLKLNLCDYAGLHISPENLEALPEYGMPFGVDWKSTSGEESTLTPEQVSMDNGGIDTEGTRSGKCTFAVHGLSGDEYGSASIRTLKLKALDHLANNGPTLGFGHSTTPQSMFNNIQLYPQMFPWLFPYGLGGIGHPDHKNRISEAAHKRFLLMYHDKGFQTDLYFPMVAFNQQQIKAGKSGSHLLAKKKHFSSVVDRLTQLDSAVLSDITSKLAAGKKFTPTTEAEKACFALLDDLDHVGNHVQGSLTSKKYMRNEIWSLTAFKVDNNHPLCLYYADNEIKFSPRIRSSDERMRLISQNPVATARFFDFMTKSFIKNVLGIGTGTRVVPWDYLESTHVGQFLTGTMEQVPAKVPHFSKRSKRIHDILEDDDLSKSCGRKDLSKFQKPGTKIKLEVKGCTRGDGTCSARFPREVHLTTEVDTKDGSIK
ncbi:hypothetical protein C8J57DRAFT_1234243 [Mycena rebaudengoi]|nr:hypothetical protein C8J57DRAFT_1234243 [Mycena rebaudengoi]